MKRIAHTGTHIHRYTGTHTHKYTDTQHTSTQQYVQIVMLLPAIVACNSWKTANMLYYSL